ncbi:hypothetical protein [Dactylosporangium sp. CA-139066]|uniref:hypothetical protein n=1 Tax=Dactylosporangium sp. CA-139066 TaxID=3239930 RepID=UPI003D941D46
MRILASAVDVPGMAIQPLPGLMPTELDSVDELLYFQAYLQAVGQARRTPMLLRALLVAAVSTFEPLVTRMMHLLLQHTDPSTYPNLTSPELDAKARKLCFGAPEQWRDVLVNRFGVAAAADAVDRHVIAHRGSVTDQRHSDKTGTEPGTVLTPTAEDVQAAIDDIGAARFGIVAAVWDHLSPGMGRRLAESGVPFHESLHAGRWRQAAVLARVEEALAADAAGIAVAKVNRWITLEQGMGYEAIRDGVQDWNVDDLPTVFSLARLILLRDDERALRIAQQLLTSGELTQQHIEDWPLFDGPKRTGRLTTLIAAESPADRSATL